MKRQRKLSKTKAGRNKIRHLRSSSKKSRNKDFSLSARRKPAKKEEKKIDRPVYKTPEELIEERSSFPEAVKKEISHIRTTLSNTAIANELRSGRRDLRKLKIVTIDSEETKDVDDGVSICRLEDGKFELGVHIADVAHYVKEGTELDLEAYKRGTSVYLVDKVLPMLPQKLSNGICSHYY